MKNGKRKNNSGKKKNCGGGAMPSDPHDLSESVFHVKRAYLAVAFISYPVALLPIAVVWLSPRPGLGGWIAFGTLSLGFAAMSTASLIFALFARVVIRNTGLLYEGIWRSFEIDLTKVRKVYPSLKYIVFDVGEARRITIPDVFVNRGRLLEAIESAKRREGESRRG